MAAHTDDDDIGSGRTSAVAGHTHTNDSGDVAEQPAAADNDDAGADVEGAEEHTPLLMQRVITEPLPSLHIVVATADAVAVAGADNTHCRWSHSRSRES